MNEKETKIVLEENKKNGSLVLMGDFNQGPAITRG
jgi:endonuclease/exonuclease/phosphatase family metal-dependent hydrolase